MCIDTHVSAVISRLIEDIVKSAYLQNIPKRTVDVQHITPLASLDIDCSVANKIILVEYRNKRRWAVAVKKSNDIVFIPIIDDVALTNKRIIKQSFFIDNVTDLKQILSSTSSEDIFQGYMYPVNQSHIIRYGDIEILRNDAGLITVRHIHTRKSIDTTCIAVKATRLSNRVYKKLSNTRYARIFSLIHCILANCGNHGYDGGTVNDTSLIHSSYTMIPTIGTSLLKQVTYNDIRYIPSFQPSHIITTSRHIYTSPENKFVQLLHYNVPLDEVCPLSEQKHMLSMNFDINNKVISIHGTARMVLSKSSPMYKSYVFEGDIHTIFGQEFFIIHNNCPCNKKVQLSNRRCQMFHYITINPLSNFDSIGHIAK